MMALHRSPEQNDLQGSHRGMSIYILKQAYENIQATDSWGGGRNSFDQIGKHVFMNSMQPDSETS